MLALIKIKLFNIWRAICLLLWPNHIKNKFYLMFEHKLVFFFTWVCEIACAHDINIYIFTL